MLAKALSKQERILSLAENEGRKEEIAKKKFKITKPLNRIHTRIDIEITEMALSIEA